MAIHTKEAENALRQSNDCLHGSPYSFPVDASGIQRLENIGESLVRIQQHLGDMSRLEDLPTPLKRILRTREIYESNAIEGLGLSAPLTLQVLDKSVREKQASFEFVEWAITQGIKNDRHTYDVIGLAAARELSRTYAKDVMRPITELDMRDLHGIILQGDPRGGIYKPYPNAILGNDDHKTALPTDTPARMNEFAYWMNNLPRRGFQTLESVVKAAAAHAWLAHIHPFDDGNGRVARLISNMLLAREGMPPLILRHEGDRTRYIDALAQSDQAGDISRLILVFCRSIERVIAEMSDPLIAQEYFEADINLRLTGEFKYWRSFIEEWTIEARGQLRIVGLSAKKVGDLQPSDFKQLQKGVAASRAWYLHVFDGDRLIGLWFFGYLPGSSRTKLNSDQYYPCLFFAARNSDPKALKPFTVPRDSGRKVVTEIMVEPHEQRCYIRAENGPLIKVSFAEAAQRFAETCSNYSNDPL